MDLFETCDINQWVENTSNNEQKEFRQAIHSILLAIASDSELKAKMILRGGILLAVRYHSHRYTKDIDLSTKETLAVIDPDEVVKSLDCSLKQATEILDYDLDCLVQGYKIQPVNRSHASFPSINLKIGYAYKGTPKHKRLKSLRSPTVISIDYSLNEVTPNIDSVKLSDGAEILAYSLTDLVAEKYRSLLQQIERKRNRRQDIFDIYMILENLVEIDHIEKRKILESLIIKAKSRNIKPEKNSFDNEELRTRAEKDYYTLEDEIDGKLPNFETSFNKVADFYRFLPWEETLL